MDVILELLALARINDVPLVLQKIVSIIWIVQVKSLVHVVDVALVPVSTQAGANE